MAFNVFISYSTNDLSLAGQVSRLLRLPGCSKPFLADYSVQPGQ